MRFFMDWVNADTEWQVFFQNAPFALEIGEHCINKPRILMSKDKSQFRLEYQDIRNTNFQFSLQMNPFCMDLEIQSSPKKLVLSKDKNNLLYFDLTFEQAIGLKNKIEPRGVASTPVVLSAPKAEEVNNSLFRGQETAIIEEFMRRHAKDKEKAGFLSWSRITTEKRPATIAELNKLANERPKSRSATILEKMKGENEWKDIFTTTEAFLAMCEPKRKQSHRL